MQPYVRWHLAISSWRGAVMTASEHPKMIFRVPPEVKAWLAAKAASNHGSMNAEILQILAAARQAEQARAG
ncbi:Arc family DNA-binding protein [Aurantimonas sp. VKM B-3413]|uniref:Arc family DNA-binding protein n=1 Tax=Aurantimonas sp. VKM B-3413 TaxID=2779401 RepID=UPI00351CDE29